MKDVRLRKKLFGIESADCLNVYTHSLYGNNIHGFVGQTIREIQLLKRKVEALSCGRYKLVELVQELKAEVQALKTKKTSKKRR